MKVPAANVDVSTSQAALGKFQNTPRLMDGGIMKYLHKCSKHQKMWGHPYCELLEVVDTGYPEHPCCTNSTTGWWIESPESIYDETRPDGWWEYELLS